MSKDVDFKELASKFAQSIFVPTLVCALRIFFLGLVAIGWFLIGILFSSDSFAREVYYGSEAETITVAYGGPTILRFDDEVKTISRASKFIIGPADKTDPNYAVLSLTPRFTKGTSKITFILANGVVVSTKIVVVPKSIPEKTDSFYDFRPKDQLIEDKKSNGKGANISELELMKAMIRWDDVVGYQKRVLVRTVKTGIKSINAKLVRIYTGPKYNGYIFKIRNLNPKKDYFVDVKSLTLGSPNVALLSQVDRKILKNAKSKENVTFLRIVAKPTSVYYNIALPVAPVSKPK